MSKDRSASRVEATVTDPVQVVTAEAEVTDFWTQRVEKAVRRSCEHFFATQEPEGFWCAELESNTTITSEYILFFHFLGLVDRDREQRMARYLLNQQRSNGAWGLYYGDGGDLSTTIEAYFALKLAGHDPASEPLRKARAFIMEHGGVQAARVFTKIWLALFGQYDWNDVPSMPVELMFLPDHFVFNIYEFSSWARATVVPLFVASYFRPQRKPAPHLGISELFAPGDHGPLAGASSNMDRLFFMIDRVLKVAERFVPRFVRERALRRAERWILEHQEDSGDWGGIQPPMVYSVIALVLLGYPTDHPEVVKGLEALERFCYEDDEGLRLQACVSPIWDTALIAMALQDAGVKSNHPSLKKGIDWMLANQITCGGDWQIKNCCPPGGWAFEFVNTQYPDVDDSAVVLMVLQRALDPGVESNNCCLERGVDWCLSMQSADGGWAAFDKDNTMTWLNRIPFADHGAMVDFPTADITGRMLELMGQVGHPASHPQARRALEFIRREQEADGCWWGRWGVNYIYGTWSVLRGLESIGEDIRTPYIRAAVRWLKTCQNSDGGWGETCESYRQPALRGQGPSTASQTAWAVMSLLSAGEAKSNAVRRGIQYLINSQKPDGTWDELHFTGTGFPGHFFIRYHGYRDYFPLMALGQYLNRLR